MNQTINRLQQNFTHLLKQGNYGAALQCIDKINILRPTNMYYLRHRIDLLIRLERVDQVIECCDEAIIMDLSCHYFYELKILYLAKYRQQEAIQCCDELLRLDPGNSHAHSYKIAILLHFGRVLEAFNFVSEEIDRQPENMELCIRKVRLLSTLEKNEDAVEYCNMLIYKGAVTSKVQMEKVEILCKLGRYQEALRCLNELSNEAKSKQRYLWYDVNRRDKLIKQVNKGVLVNRLRFRMKCFLLVGVTVLMFILLNPSYFGIALPMKKASLI